MSENYVCNCEKEEIFFYFTGLLYTGNSTFTFPLKAGCKRYFYGSSKDSLCGCNK